MIEALRALAAKIALAHARGEITCEVCGCNLTLGERHIFGCWKNEKKLKNDEVIESGRGKTPS